jgi:predicted HicB family RNase H-like nuclease
MRMELPPLPPASKEFISPRDIKMAEFVASQPVLRGNKKRPMLDTPFVGACTVCRLTASLAVDPTDYKTLERVLEGKVVKAICSKCRKEVEFRPLSPEELAEEQFYIMRRNEEIRDKIFRAAAANGKSVPEHVEGALNEYMKRMDHALGKKAKQLESGVVVPEGKIIIPE